MLRGCVRLNEKQKKVLLVVWCTVALLVLLALLEPGYQKICTYTDHPYHEYCAFYNVVAAALWHIGDGLNYFGPAIAGVSTVAVAVFTWTLWRSTDRAGEHFRVTERAYVKMSHISNMRPGVQWSEPDTTKTDAADFGKFSVLVEIKNCGRTPGRVTAVWLTCEVVPEGQEFPINFSYADGDLSYDSGEGYSFVTPNDTIYVPQKLEVHKAERSDIEEGKSALIVFGYVDYIDQFDERQRGGYGRQYIPNIGGNNLGFPIVRAKLNYDEPRTPSVGWDWPKT